MRVSDLTVIASNSPYTEHSRSEKVLTLDGGVLMQQLALWILAGLAIGGLVFWVFSTSSNSGPTEAPARTQSSESTESTQLSKPTEPSETVESTESIEPSEAISNAEPSAEVEASNVNNTAVPEPLFETSRELVVGPLAPGKYLNALRLSQLGLPEQDLNQVRYWADLQLDSLMSGGPPPDGIPSIDEPRFVAPADADAWLPDEALVVGLSLNGETRAYPIAILNWHEIVNDTLGDTTVVVTYCPLCNSSIAFLAPQIDGVTATFGTSGRLYLSDLVMYDRVTGTFWSQLEGAPIVGPMVGVIESLKRTPIDVMPYGFWKADHPNGVVLDRPKAGDVVGRIVAERGNGPDGLLRDYTRDPYARYRVTNPAVGGRTQFGIPINDDRLQAKDSIVGVLLNEQAKAFAHDAVLAQRLINDWVGDVPVVLAAATGEKIRIFERTLPNSDTIIEFESVDADTLIDSNGNRWGLDGVALDGPHQGARLEEVVGTIAFWFSWITFNPDTELFVGDA